MKNDERVIREGSLVCDGDGVGIVIGICFEDGFSGPGFEGLEDIGGLDWYVFQPGFTQWPDGHQPAVLDEEWMVRNMRVLVY